MGQALSRLLFPRRLKILVLPGSFSGEELWRFTTEELPELLHHSDPQHGGPARGWSATLGDLVEFKVCLPSAAQEAEPWPQSTPQMATYYRGVSEKVRAYLKELDMDELHLRNWWNGALDALPIEGHSLPPGVSLPDEVVDAALGHVRSFVAQHGPFHGVLGFSQGAALAQLLLAGAARGEVDFDFAMQFRFAVAISGFDLPPFAKYRHLAPPAEALQLPAFAIAGARDYARHSCERMAVNTFGLAGLSEEHQGDHTVGFTPSAGFRAFLQEEWHKVYPADDPSSCCERRRRD
ncbi:unnamed protein product [Polarella glacialis]|uniref:Serine hydrolase domain-containing protein n=1 Tax=Polarella glacialis TaxID=89957 RepID=A0A813JDJ3_POLGL|nr:unnamed protein product [Polarella glacialis]